MFTQVCLVVAGILGAVCSSHEEVYPIGDCANYGTTMVCYVDDPEQLRVRTQPYHPHQCQDSVENINCLYVNGKSTGDRLGDLTPTNIGYGKMLACPIGMYGDILRFEEIGDWQCRDSGEGIKVNFGRYYTGTEEGFVYEWVIVVDFLLWETEWWTYMVLPFEVIYDWGDNTMCDSTNSTARHNNYCDAISKMVRIEDENYLRHIIEFSAN